MPALLTNVHLPPPNGSQQRCRKVTLYWLTDLSQRPALLNLEPACILQLEQTKVVFIWHPSGLGVSQLAPTPSSNDDPSLCSGIALAGKQRLERSRCITTPQLALPREFHVFDLVIVANIFQLARPFNPRRRKFQRHLLQLKLR